MLSAWKYFVSSTRSRQIIKIVEILNNLTAVSPPKRYGIVIIQSPSFGPTAHTYNLH